MEPSCLTEEATFSDTQKTELVRALEHLRNANSRDNTKGDLIKAWFDQNVGQPVAVSFITEGKQIGNRFKEQRGKNALYTLFFFEDEALIDRAKGRISEYLYADLKAVFFFYYDHAHTLRLAMSAGEQDWVTRKIIETFGDHKTNSEVLPSSGTLGTLRSPHRLNVPTKTTASFNLVGIDSAYEQAVASILAGKHVLFIGPPGTAKTELSECLCKAFGTEYSLATATAEWTTFETIGGYLTSLDASGSNELDFNLGVVTESIASNKWLIIDEFNRADMDKAFGELFTILMGKTIDLPYQKRTSSGPQSIQIGPNAVASDKYCVDLQPDWRMVATMNSFDKASLARLSLALMRRFSIIHVDAPAEADYEKLIRTISESQKPSDSAVHATYDRASSKLVSFFASEAPGGLRSIGLEVGPAIPIDATKYIARRVEMTSCPDIEGLVVEALVNYLFPQFEGRDDVHEQIIEALGRCLGLAPADLEAASERLAVFTGYSSAR